LLHWSLCRNCLLSIEFAEECWFELSHCGLDQLFDPSALEISFVPGTALQFTIITKSVRE